MSLSVVFDHAQRRVKAERVGVAAGGMELNGSLWQNTWIDPVSHTLMLRPQVMDAEWATSNAGRYAKLSAADFGLGSAWEERADQHWKGPWLAVKDSAVNEPAVTVADWEQNRGFVLAWFSYGNGETFCQMEAGWGPSASVEEGVALRCWTDGRVEVYRDGVLAGSGRVSGQRTGDVRAGRVFELMLLPFRQRELLVWSRSGDGFVVTFVDMELDDEEAAITPAGKFWFHVVEGATQVQVCPVRFPLSGYATSVETALAAAPLEDAVAEEFDQSPWSASIAPGRVIGHPAGSAGEQSAVCQLVDWDGTSFEPNGESDQIRLRVDLETTDEAFSPFVTSAHFGFEQIAAVTPDDEEVDATAAVVSCVLSVGDSADAVRLDLELLGPETVSTVVPGLMTVANRPVGLKLGGALILDGLSGRVETEFKVTDKASTYTTTVRDAWKTLDSATAPDRIVLDGMLLTDAVRLLAGWSGVEVMTVSASEVRLPNSISQRAGDWGLLVEPGDSIGQWMQRLLETFAPGWLYGIRPQSDGSGPEFYAVSAGDLPEEPSLTLYRSVEEAVALGGLSPSAARERVVRSYRETVTEPFANDVRVTGHDPQTGRPFVWVREDTDSIDPSLLPSERPTNWVGERRRASLTDASLTTMSEAALVGEALFTEWSKPFHIAEFQSSLLTTSEGVPLWRGDMVEIAGQGFWRIRSFSCDFRFESEGGVWRNANYVVEKVEA